MSRVINAELYKIRHCRILWAMPFLFFAIGFIYSAFPYKAYNLYDGLELFALPSLTYQQLSIGFAMLTGYVIGLDFSCLTIQNTLSVGVDRRSYYFARMGVVMLLTALLYGVVMLGFVCGRLPLFQPLLKEIFSARGTLAANRPKLELFWIKLAVCAAVNIMQLWAYVSILNAACYYIKKQLTAMVAGLAFIIAELAFRQVADRYGLTALRRLFDLAPVRVLQHTFDLYAVRDEILTPGFLKFGISALVIIAVSSAVGFFKFRLEPGSPTGN